tara:strand:- start:32 stop:1312 length:1281 start_codon:yes stop_codon:yes gene_type:complete
MGYVSPSKKFYQDLFKEHKLTLFLEGRYGSEHGYRKVWNEFRHNSQIKDYLTKAIDILRDKNASDEDKEEAEQKMQWTADHMRERIAAAKEDPNDPLHFSNAKSKNFTKGKTDDDAESYYNELENNIDAVAFAATSRKMRTSVENGWKMLSSGKSKGELTKTASRDGTGITSKTSKSDNVVIAPASDKKGEDTGKYKKVGISHKQGANTQIAAGEPGEIRGTGNQIAKEYASKFPKGKERDAEYKRILDMFDKIADNSDYRGDDENEIKRRNSANKELWDKMAKEEPKILQSFTQANASGRGKFVGDKGSDINRSTADVIVNVPATGKTNQVSSIKPIEKQPGVIPDPSKGKGEGRTLTNRQRNKLKNELPLIKGLANTVSNIVSNDVSKGVERQAQQDATPKKEHGEVVDINKKDWRDSRNRGLT